jgi:hypothetical protein
VFRKRFFALSVRRLKKREQDGTINPLKNKNADTKGYNSFFTTDQTGLWQSRPYKCKN